MDTAESLVAAAQSGSELAFEQLYRLNSVKAFRIAYAVLGDRSEAEDATQEAFIRAFRSIGNLRVGVPFASWLWRNVVWAARRRRRRLSLWLSRAEAATRVSSQTSAEFEPELLAHHSVMAALQELPVAAREVVILRYYNDLSIPEIAVVLDCAEGTVKSRISRALARLSDTSLMTELRADLAHGS